MVSLIGRVLVSLSSAEFRHELLSSSRRVVVLCSLTKDTGFRGTKTTWGVVVWNFPVREDVGQLFRVFFDC